MSKNFNNNSNREIKVDKKDWTTSITNYIQVIPNSQGFSNLEQIEAWIDRNKNQMGLEEFVKELLLRIRNTRNYGYNLEKTK